MRPFRRTAAVLGVLTVLVAAKPVRAQSLSVRAGAGVAVPVGSAGEHRDAGPAAMLSVESRLGRLWSVRLDGEWSLLKGPAAPAGFEDYKSYNDLRTVGASLNASLRLSENAFAPYLLAGVGLYRLQRVGAPRTSYGNSGALQAGFGVDAKLSHRLDAFAEARAQLHINDYGAAEFEPTRIWPVILGVRIR
jgi:hypothetical protein